MAGSLRPSMLELAHIISDRSARLTEALEGKNLPQPSFAADAPTPDFIPDDEPELRGWRDEIWAATEQLHDLVSGSKTAWVEKIMLKMHDAWTSQTINEYNIWQCVPLEGTASYASISKKSGLDEDKCRRILRYAMTNHVFYEPEPEQVAHTAISAMLAKDQGARDFGGHCLEELHYGTANQVKALKKWPGSLHPGETGTSMGHGVDGKSIFEFFGMEPWRAQRFGGAMGFLGSSGTNLAPEIEVAHGYPWQSLGKAKLVDCGGSRGHVSVAIANVAPEMSFVIQDLPEVVSQAKAHPPDGLKERFQYQAYDFFTPQPLKDADVYFFRRIFHDWPDESCLQILENLVPSMKAGSRIIMNETILSAPGGSSASYYEHKVGRTLDMQMLVAANARERTLDDWHQMFDKGGDGKLSFERGEQSILAWVKKA